MEKVREGGREGTKLKREGEREEGEREIFRERWRERTYHTPQAAYYFTGILFNKAVFTLNNHLIKRRK